MSATPPKKQSLKAPDKGVFPLDHFHECDKEAEMYNNCVVKHQLMPKRCRQYQIDYLQCRMKSGLMEKEEIEKLGFTKEVSWETEDAEKKELWGQIQNLKSRAFRNAQAQADFEKKKSQPQEPTKPAPAE